ncbi:MAG: flagellin, partial [Chloroflexi bacterium]|nr:flagellin [Chloroflexota bacterium]
MFKTSRGMDNGQRGITGLETAIILIAFVVVASVFAFTVLSTGIFASERSKETVFAGL